MKKAKEVPASTKPMGKDDVRHNHPGQGNPAREHPFKNTGPGAGYKNVGKPSKQGKDDARHCGPKDRSVRSHPHQGK